MTLGRAWKEMGNQSLRLLREVLARYRRYIRPMQMNFRNEEGPTQDALQKCIWRQATAEKRMPGTELRTNTFGILFCGLILFEGEGGIIGTTRNFLYTCIFCQ